MGQDRRSTTSVRPNSIRPKLRVITCCYGLSTDSHLSTTDGKLPALNIEIIAGCDYDKKLRKFFETHNPNAESYGDMNDMVHAVITDTSLKKKLSSPDILWTTSPCQGRSVLREENNISPEVKHKDDPLFLLQLYLVQLLRPKRVVSEITPPHSTSHEDHSTVINRLEQLGYEVVVTDRFPSDLCGDIQHRERWIMVGRLKGNQPLKPFALTTNLNRLPIPLSKILEPPTKIPDTCWLCNDFIEIFEEPEPYVKNPRHAS